MSTIAETKTNGTAQKSQRKRSFAKLGYSKAGSHELVNALNNLLANYSVHYQKLRNYHWNVKGADFFDIHEQFEDQYNEAKVAIDDIAERIRVFGHTPLSTMKDYLETAEIKETGTEMEGMEMVKEILNDYQILIEFMYDAIEVAIDHGDMGTEDMVKGFVFSIEKHHWMMTSFSADS
jgi:starvation-inducible DNA-binding protein